MQVVFRTDASPSIGTGHVMRCLTLASAMRKRGAVVTFVSREHSGSLCNLIEKQGFAVSRLSTGMVVAQSEDIADHPASLGASWQEDARQTSAAIAVSGVRPDWLVVDHYAIDYRWEGILRASKRRQRTDGRTRTAEPWPS